MVKLVEEAEKRPLEELVDCPACGAQNLRGHDVCNVCQAVMIGKTCINVDCKKTIPQSAASCPTCGISQITEVIKPWTCEVCFAVNSEDLRACSHCTFSRGTPHPLSKDRLSAGSSKSDELSIKGLTLELSDGSNSNPLDVDVAITKDSLTPAFGSKSIPLHSIKTPERIEIYLDLSHPIFRSFQLSPEQLIAAEVALVVYDANRRLSGSQHQGVHTLSNLTWQILSKRWKGSLEDGTDRVRNDIRDFFNGLRERLPVLLSDLSIDIFNDMEECHKSEMFKNLLAAGVDLTRLESMKASGQFLFYAGDRVIVDLFKNWPDYFFDGKLWNEPWNSLKELTGMDMQEMRNKTCSEYANCLDDLVSFVNLSAPDVNATSRARLSLKILTRKLV